MTMMESEPISSETERNPLASLALQQLEAKLLQWTKEQYRAARSARESAEQQWYINEAFYFGRQNVRVLAAKTATGNYSLITPKAPPWRVRLVVNKVRPIVRNQVAKLTSNAPTAYVLPTSADEEDLTAARVAERIWEAAYRDLKVDTITHDVAWWGSIAGTAFFKTYWDPTARQGQGDARIECVDPFHIFVPDLHEKDIENQPFVIHGMTRNVNNVQRNYGINTNPISHSTDPFMEQSYLASQGVTNSRTLKEVPCFEVWMKPDAHPEFPEGGLITVIGDRVVQMVKGYPYSHNEYPFAKFEDVQTGKFYADSVINDLIGLQREYNRTRSQIIEAKNLMAKPRLIAPRGSVNPRMITSEPGQVILYTPGFQPPTPLPIDPLPSYVLQEVDRIQQDIDDISGQHEISRGQNPPQVTAASALTYLNEQDESKLQTSVRSMERAIEKVAKQYLKFVIDYWDEPRMVKVAGKDNAFEAYAWKAGDLRGNIDLRIEAGSALPQSKAARQAFLMDLFKMGALGPEQMYQALDMRGLEKAYEDMLIDRRQAQRENLKMSELAAVPAEALMAPVGGMEEGAPPSPNSPPTGQVLMPPELAPNEWDNHEAHVHYHNQYRKTQEFERLPEHVKQIFSQHVQIHQQALMMGVQPSSGGPVIGGDPTMGGSVDPAQDMSAEQSQAIQSEG